MITKICRAILRFHSSFRSSSVMRSFQKVYISIHRQQLFNSMDCYKKKNSQACESAEYDVTDRINILLIIFIKGSHRQPR